MQKLSIFGIKLYGLDLHCVNLDNLVHSMYNTETEGGVTVSISYKPLWHQLIERDMKKLEFRDLVGMSNTTLAKLGKNEPVSLEIIDKICIKLECSIQDVVEIK